LLHSAKDEVLTKIDKLLLKLTDTQFMRFFIQTFIEFLKDKDYRSLLGASILILFGGAFFYMYAEGWRFLDALYFSAITLTTIGYGDFTPQTDLGKAFTIVYIALGVGLILTFVNTVFNHFKDARKNYGVKQDK
jgi:TRAP-type C4-dicarboxylate transport system permease small subunit